MSRRGRSAAGVRTTKKKPEPKKLDIRIARVHALLDELLFVEEGLEPIKEMIEQVDWSMVDHDTLKEIFTLVMSNCPSDPDSDPDHTYSEERRNRIAAVAERAHRRVVAVALSANYGEVLPRAVEIADLWAVAS